MIDMSKNSKKFGYTLVEMIVYVAVISLISLVIVNTTLSFSRSYRHLQALRIVDDSGSGAMERMTRDIRAASTIDVANSTLGSSPGVLTVIATANSISTTTKFYLQNNIAKADVNGSYFGPLTLSTATTTSLVFTKLDSPISHAIKIDMTVVATVGGVTKTKNYHSTIILKGL